MNSTYMMTDEMGDVNFKKYCAIFTSTTITATCRYYNYLYCNNKNAYNDLLHWYKGDIFYGLSLI